MSDFYDRLDAAAEAAWLCHIVGMTQDEIARHMGVSRPAVQRLLSLASKHGMVKTRIDHTSVRSLELGASVKERFNLSFCTVVPSIPSIEDGPTGVSHALATEMEKWLGRAEPVKIGLGTGKTLRSAIGHLPHIDCPQHTIVSLAGNVAPDGSIAKYNVLFSISEKVSASAYSLPMPLISSTVEELNAVRTQKSIERTVQLAQGSDAAFVGIGQMSGDVPLLTDGFISKSELRELQAASAVGEIIGWVFDSSGKRIETEVCRRVGSIQLPLSGAEEVVGAAKGIEKLSAVLAALRGHWVTALVTDESLAEALIAHS